MKKFVPPNKVDGFNYSDKPEERRFYHTWQKMKARAKGVAPAHVNARYYDRGITLDQRWDSYLNFKSDMYEEYVKHTNKHGMMQTTLERIDNDKGYSPENCTWADRKTQALNRKQTKLFTFSGLSLTLSDWARKLDINRSTLAQRFYVLKWSIEKTLTFNISTKTRGGEIL